MRCSPAMKRCAVSDRLRRRCAGAAARPWRRRNRRRRRMAETRSSRGRRTSHEGGGVAGMADEDDLRASRRPTGRRASAAMASSEATLAGPAEPRAGVAAHTGPRTKALRLPVVGELQGAGKIDRQEDDQARQGDHEMERQAQHAGHVVQVEHQPARLSRRPGR